MVELPNPLDLADDSEDDELDEEDDDSISEEDLFIVGKHGRRKKGGSFTISSVSLTVAADSTNFKEAQRAVLGAFKRFNKPRARVRREVV